MNNYEQNNSPDNNEETPSQESFHCDKHDINFRSYCPECDNQPTILMNTCMQCGEPTEHVDLCGQCSTKLFVDFSDLPDYDFAHSALNDFHTEAVTKFIKGQQEHGGSIFDRNLTKEIGQEVIDLFFYHRALNDKIEVLAGKVAVFEAALPKDFVFTYPVQVGLLKDIIKDINNL